MLIRPRCCAVQLVLNVLHWFRARQCEGEAPAHTANLEHGAACGLLCRELCRKMQLLIFKLECAKCLIFWPALRGVSNHLALLFQDYSPTQFGRSGRWESGMFFHHDLQLTAVRLFSLPFLLCFSD